VFACLTSPPQVSLGGSPHHGELSDAILAARLP
jgi:hypothetical protein